MNYEKVSIMNQKALKTLEYDKIIEQLASYASSPLGRKKCLELVPSSSLSQITRDVYKRQILCIPVITVSRKTLR